MARYFGSRTMSALIGAAGFALVAAAPAPQAALPTDGSPEAMALAALFEAETITTDAFADPSFVGPVASAVAALEAALGMPIGIERGEAGLVTVFPEARVPTQIALDAQGRIAGLLFGPPQPLEVGTVEESVAAFADLPGRVSVLVERNGEAVAAIDPEAALAVGSAFKLAALAVAREDFASGTRAPEDVVALRAEAMSLPSGILQDWPAGTPVTLQTLLDLMISISDNTATDNLIATLGADRVAEALGIEGPLLATGDLFRLKAPDNTALLERWRTGDAAERERVLGEAREQPLPDIAMFATSTPIAIDVEWLVPATTLCDLLEATHGDPAFAINPGVADPDDFASIAFKGGSEPGVLNLSTRVETADGTAWCVVATWNDETAALDELALAQRYSGVLAAITAEIDAGATAE